MKINEASIDIVRNGNVLISVSVEMPIWDKLGEDGFMSVNIPLLGIKTFAKDVEDSDVAVEEAIKSFCLNSEKFGNGVENDLKKIGWEFTSQKENTTSMSFFVTNSNSVIDQIMQTGDQFVQKLELAC